CAVYFNLCAEAVGLVLAAWTPVKRALFRFKVFHRDGELCERCGGIIEKTTLSSRPFYWCPGCQH
ncbi:zinc finger domain-containing protein, partial [Escherichia coli]